MEDEGEAVQARDSGLALQPRPLLRVVDAIDRSGLRHVDAHETIVRADPRRVWSTLGEVLERERMPGRGWIARMPRAEPHERCGDPLSPVRRSLGSGSRASKNRTS